MENKDVNGSVGNENGEENRAVFSYVKEKVRSSTWKKCRRALHIVGLSFVAAIVFGLTARAVFVWSGPVFEDKLMDRKTDTEDQVPAQTEQRSEVLIGAKDTDIRNEEATVSPKQTKPSKTPSKAPSKAPTLSPTEEPVLTQAAGEKGRIPENGAEVPEDPDAANQSASGGASNEIIEGSTGANKDAANGTEAEDDPTEMAATDGSGTDISQTDGMDIETGMNGKEDDLSEEAEVSPLRMYARMMAEMKAVAGYVKHSITEVRAVNGGVNWLDENIETQTEHTGTIIGNNGVELLILTCYDEMATADRIEVAFEDGSVAAAVLYGEYSDMDIAVVAVKLSDISEETGKMIRIIETGDSKTVAKGDPVIAIGSTNGYSDSLNFGFVTSEGVKSYVFDNSADLFMLDIDQHKGADGVIVNLDGQLVGLITDRLGDQENGVCTVVGLDSILAVLYKMANRLRIPYFGIRAENIPEKILEGMGIENGIYVNEVAAGSPAAQAGIRKGDVIRTVNDQEIGSVEDYSAILSAAQINERLSVEIYRSSAAETAIRLLVRTTAK